MPVSIIKVMCYFYWNKKLMLLDVHLEMYFQIGFQLNTKSKECCLQSKQQYVDNTYYLPLFNKTFMFKKN